ncbi:MAG: hypothetical protein EGR46_11820, partial [Ruminococcus sp.]|nr:hypothetical protein [Ruminococcus sp.]
QEIYYGKVYYSYEELKQAIIKYIDYYNNKRIKQKLGWLSPVEYRINALVANKSVAAKSHYAFKSNFLGSPQLFRYNCYLFFKTDFFISVLSRSSGVSFLSIISCAERTFGARLDAPGCECICKVIFSC